MNFAFFRFIVQLCAFKYQPDFILSCYIKVSVKRMKQSQFLKFLFCLNNIFCMSDVNLSAAAAASKTVACSVIFFFQYIFINKFFYISEYVHLIPLPLIVVYILFYILPQKETLLNLCLQEEQFCRIIQCKRNIFLN